MNLIHLNDGFKIIKMYKIQFLILENSVYVLLEQ